MATINISLNRCFILLLITLMSLSCHQRGKKHNYFAASQQNNLVATQTNERLLFDTDAEILEFEDMFLADPHTITYHKDDYLLLQDKLKSNLLLIIDLEQKKAYRKINQGRAENELIYLAGLILKDSDIYAYSLSESKLLKLAYDKTTRTFTFSNSITFPRQFMNCAPTDKGYITLASGSSGERIFLWDNNMEVTDTLGSYPTEGIENLKNANNAALQSDWAFSPDGLHFVTAYKKIDYIDIYESNLLKKRIRGPKIYDVTINRRKVGDDAYMTTVSPSHFSYKTVVADNNGFWVGYLGLEIKNGMIPTQDMNRLTKVFHFDWDGNLIQTYRFDNPVENFGIDPETNKMYCLTGSPDPRILIYKLAD